ncbi:MAG: hypothetical protein PHF84_09385 [bacterium]|nr:hypothetical protein [bacterium]
MRAKGLLLLFMCVPVLVSGYSFYQDYYYTMGDPVFGVNARQLALAGSTGLIPDGAASLVNNPAYLGLNKRITFQVNAEMASVSEEVRTLFSEDNEDLQNNSFIVWGYDNIGLSYPVADFLILGAGYYKYMDLNYQYNFYEYTFNDDLGSSGEYVRTGISRYEKKGDIKKIPIGVSADIRETLLFGFSYNVIRGSGEEFYTKDIFTNRNDPYIESDSTYRSGSISAGLVIRVTRGISLGGYFETGAEMKIDSQVRAGLESTNQQQEEKISSVIKYPSRLGLNISIQPHDAYSSSITADIRLNNWKGASVRIDDFSGDYPAAVTSQTDIYHYRKETRLSEVCSGLRDVLEFSFGAEHVFPMGQNVKMPVRYGFLYRPSPFSRDVQLTAVSLGAGLQLVPYRKLLMEIDFGYLYGVREVIDYQEGLYPAVLAGDSAFIRKIKENFNIFMLSITVKY